MTDISAIGLPPAAEKKIREAWEKRDNPAFAFHPSRFEVDGERDSWHTPCGDGRLSAELLSRMTNRCLRSIPYVGDKAIEAIRAWREGPESASGQTDRINGEVLEVRTMRGLGSTSRPPTPIPGEPERFASLARDILLALIQHGGKATPDMADNAQAVAKRFYDAT